MNINRYEFVAGINILILCVNHFRKKTLEKIKTNNIQFPTSFSAKAGDILL